MKAEEKAKELYPIDNDMFINRFAKIENATRQAQQEAFLKGVEFAQQQKPQSSEVDYQKMFANCKLPNEQLQSSNIDMSDWHFCKVYGFREGIDKCSGCDQDKVRKAAERAFKEFDKLYMLEYKSEVNSTRIAEQRLIFQQRMYELEKELEE